MFNLRNVEVMDNEFIGSKYLSADLFHGDIFVIRLYEHMFEGGYYPNGEPANMEFYVKFIEENNKNNDELDSFHTGVKKLVEEQNAYCKK